MATDWKSIGAALTAECPNTFYRLATEEILEEVESLGPTRPAESEYKRVYRFLHYNEPSRIKRVLAELAARKKRGDAKLDIRADAWAYTAAAFDEWINHARILFVVVGILEGTLRSRVDAHLTVRFGSEWPLDENAVPDNVRDHTKAAEREKQIQSIRDLLMAGSDEEQASHRSATIISELHAIVAPKEPNDPKLRFGAAFVTTLDLGRLQSLLQTK
ncbi:MAG: hypothetical protein AB1762_14080, partial [Gemmatimonadota bacterium]